MHNICKESEARPVGWYRKDGIVLHAFSVEEFRAIIADPQKWDAAGWLVDALKQEGK